jgi:hypothetical protein
MASWTGTNQELKDALAGKELFVEENALRQEPDCFYGPSATKVKAALPDLLGSMPLTDTPWQQPDASRAWGIGVNNTYWVISPNSTRKGIWVLDSSSAEAAKNAQAAGAPTQYGYYRKVSDQIPPIAQLTAANLLFESGFSEAYYRDYPDQDPRPKTVPKGTVKVKTFELFGFLGGENVLATDVLQYIGPGDYVLADGAQLFFGNAPADGFGLGGDPGKWNTYYPSQTPSAFGLSSDKGVLMWDGQKGVVLTGQVLQDIFGAQWKSIVYS